MVLILKFLVLCESLLEVPIFLLRNRKMFENSGILLLHQWSFGHTAVNLDYTSRLYAPHRISVVYIPHRASNPFLPFCFGHNLDPFVFKSLTPQFNRFEIEAVRSFVLRLFLSLISACTRKFFLIEQETVYQTLSLAQNRLKIGEEETGRFKSSLDFTGYVRLLRDGIGRPPELPIEFKAGCEATIRSRYPSFFEKPFVTVLLRSKGKGGEFSDVFRCSGPASHYVPAVQALVRAGFHVALTGETDRTAFAGIPGVFDFTTGGGVGAQDPKVLNLYLLLYPRLFMGQQSGPHVLPNARGVLCLLTDALPHRIGTFAERDIILFKHLKVGGKVLRISEVYKDFPDLAYGYHFKERGAEIIENTPAEITQAVEDALQVLREGKDTPSPEDARLIEAFRRLPEEGMTLRYHRNRPPLFVLREDRDGLLK